MNRWNSIFRDHHPERERLTFPQLGSTNRQRESHRHVLWGIGRHRVDLTEPTRKRADTRWNFAACRCFFDWLNHKSDSHTNRGKQPWATGSSSGEIGLSRLLKRESGRSEPPSGRGGTQRRELGSQGFRRSAVIAGLDPRGPLGANRAVSSSHRPANTSHRVVRPGDVSDSLLLGREREAFHRGGLRNTITFQEEFVCFFCIGVSQLA